MGWCILRNVVDIFRDIVADLGQTIDINSIVDNGNDTWTISTSKTKWLRPYINSSALNVSNKITIDSVEYPIKTLVYNTSITIDSTDDLTNATTFDIAPPYYINGTQLAVNQERKTEQFEWNQCPFVWLAEPFRSNESSSKMDVFSSKPNLTLFWLDNQNSNDWSTADHYEKVILPLNEIVEAFKRKILSMKTTFNKVTDWQTTIHVKFGEVAKVGHISSIIDEKTSGIESSLTVEILKNCYC